jgi:hypothetical protein
MGFQVVLVVDVKSGDRGFVVKLAQILQQDLKHLVAELDALVDLDGPVKARVRPATVKEVRR